MIWVQLSAPVLKLKTACVQLAWKLCVASSGVRCDGWRCDGEITRSAGGSRKASTTHTRHVRVVKPPQSVQCGLTELAGAWLAMATVFLAARHRHR